VISAAITGFRTCRSSIREFISTGNPPPAIRQVKTREGHSARIYTMSKTYFMEGWRSGFAVGNKRLSTRLRAGKFYLDYGAFKPIRWRRLRRD